jgi:RNA polymerase sigma factor (sigma-70 family)
MWTFAATEKSVALRTIRKTDPSRYTAICKILAEEEVEEGYETIPLEYVYDLADEGPSPEDVVFETEMKTAASRILSKLTPREERVIRRRFGIGVTDATLATIGDEFWVTAERIREIEAKALRKLKHPSRSRKCIPFIEEIAA